MPLSVHLIVGSSAVLVALPIGERDPARAVSASLRLHQYRGQMLAVVAALHQVLFVEGAFEQVAVSDSNLFAGSESNLSTGLDSNLFDAVTAGGVVR